METAMLDDYRDGTYSLESISAVYTQDPDCCQDRGDFQRIKLETVNNGVASFIRISLPDGGYWSISDEHDLENLLKDFKSRFIQKKYEG